MSQTFDQTVAQVRAPRWVLRSLIGIDVAMIERWIERSNQRHALAELDDDQLRDIGLSGRDARREASKPFWK